MKQATMILALLGAIALAGCGNGDTTSQTNFNNGSGDQPFKPITHLSHRSLVSNNFANHLQLVDATQDRLTTFTVPVGAQPTYIQPSPDGTLSFVYNSANNTVNGGSNSISSVNNNLEAVKATINLGGFTESFVTSVSNKSGFAAVYNFSNGNAPNPPGAILPFNPTDGSVNTAIKLANVRYLALDPAEKHMLAFTDVLEGTPADFEAHWVDLTSFDANGLPLVSVLPLPAGTLSRPVAAFFSADNNTAYILSCGIECGGTGSARVTILNVSNDASAPVVLKQILVPGAFRGLIDLTAKKLYVAGSSTSSASNDCLFQNLATCSSSNNGGHNVQDGFFTTIDLAAQTASAPIRIGNGVKRWIRNVNGIFWVASLNCGVESCISMVNPTTGTATTLPTALGDGTGLSLSVNSGEVYTIEGGELFIYNQKGTPIVSQYTTDVKGQASDVLYID